MTKILFLVHRQLSVLLLVLCGILPWSASATVQISLDAGYLRTKTGGALTPATSGIVGTAGYNAGALLMLVAADKNSNTFSNTLSAGQYKAGGDTILATFSFNNFGASTSTTDPSGQTTNNSLNFTLPTTVNQGSTLVELRWFPDITLAQYNAGTTPSSGMAYGVYNPSLFPALNGTTLNPDGGNDWVVPVDGSNGYSLVFHTTDTAAANAKQASTEGYANFTVAVPEPSTGVLAGVGLVVIVGATRFWRRTRDV